MSDILIKDPIGREIVGYLETSVSHVSPVELERNIYARISLDKKAIRKAIRCLVDEGILEYSEKNGMIRISLSFDRPVKISKNITIIPPGRKKSDTDGSISIFLNKGTAFGSGEHPTTQLCIQALEELGNDFNFVSCQDIGTGSGILAIAAAKLGAMKVHACDRDPMAVFEAQKNVRENNLEHVITVEHEADFENNYDLIIANLRYPTLIDLFPFFLKMTKKNSMLIFSGIKTEEIEIVKSVYLEKKNYTEVWTGEKKGWVGIVFKK
jgi:ribosomal protein L11 methyltransferase